MTKQILNTSLSSDVRPLIGHEKIISLLSNLLDNQKLPPVLLLYGIKGIGKATLAYQIVNLMLKLDQNLVTYAHPHVLVINSNQVGRSRILLEDIVLIKQFVHHTPLQSELPKVVVIDSIDDMNIQSQNALLGLLEEPPWQTQFIIMCHKLHTIIPPLLSRCYRVNLQPLCPSEMGKILKIIKHESAIPYIPAAQGSIEQALLLANFPHYQLLLQIIMNYLQGNESSQIWQLINFVTRDMYTYIDFIKVYDSLCYRLFTTVLKQPSSESYNLLKSEEPIIKFFMNLDLAHVWLYFSSWQRSHEYLHQNVNSIANVSSLLLYVLESTWLYTLKT